MTSATDGTAIAGATVTDSGGASTTTNNLGVYTLVGLPPGNASLTASATGFTASSPQTASVTVGQTTQGVDFSLSPLPGAITGTVSNSADATAIAGATITDSAGGTPATTDANGVYTLSGLTPGSHTLTASAIGFGSGTQTVVVNAGQTTQGTNFSLTPLPGAVTGTVTSTSGAAAIVGATVTDSGGASATTDCQRRVHPERAHPGQPRLDRLGDRLHHLPAAVSHGDQRSDHPGRQLQPDAGSRVDQRHRHPLLQRHRNLWCHRD